MGVGRSPIPATTYCDRLIDELRAVVAEHHLKPNDIASIFFGGGTPTMLPADAFARLLDGIADTVSLPGGMEITCEANPETLDAPYLSRLRQTGVNRLSMGVQSFRPEALTFLDRIHSSKQVVDAVGWARNAGFHNLNLDLMFGLPQQSTAMLEADLAAALELAVPHLSAYQLTVEAGTPLALRVRRGAVVLPPEERLLRFWHIVRERLAQAGYSAYEVSNYARPGHECRHNLHYWNGGEYLGLGPGAVSRIGAHRWRRRRHVQRYLDGELAVDETETLMPAQLALEYCLLALRTEQGLSLEAFAQRAGERFDALYPGIRAQWIAHGWALDGPRLRMTVSGLAILDTLLADLL